MHYQLPRQKYISTSFKEFEKMLLSICIFLCYLFHTECEKWFILFEHA